MKQLRIYILFALLIFGILAGRFLFQQGDVAKQNPSLNDVSNSATSQSAGILKEAKRKLIERSSLSFRTSANVTVDVHAKVLDETDSPLVGVKVLYKVRRWNGLNSQLPATFETFTSISTGSGEVNLKEGAGDVVTIVNLEKQGYSPDSSALRNIGINISQNQTSSIVAPVLLRMWKIGYEPRSIAKGKIVNHLQIDNKPHVVPLVSEAGETLCNMVFSIHSAGPIDNDDQVDWGFTMTLEGGELKEEVDAYQNLRFLPVTGFNPTFSYQVPQKQWTAFISRRFYFKVAPKGIWGNVAIDVNARRDDGTATVRCKYEIYAQKTGSASREH
jgi:hypothetical protein